MDLVNLKRLISTGRSSAVIAILKMRLIEELGFKGG